jgi:hypothetical protein
MDTHCLAASILELVAMRPFLNGTAALLIGIGSWVSEVAAEKISLPTRPSERPRLKSVYSVEHELSELHAASRQGIVLFFLDNNCPVARQYAPTMSRLHAEFQAKGMAFYGIYPNARVHVLAMAQHALADDLPFPVFLDREQKLAKLLEVSVTPEVVVIDAQWHKVYQGAIDNQFKKGGRISDATKNYLRDALTSFLANEPVAEPFTRASGCPLESNQRVAAQQPVTFHRDIEPIIQRNCQVCHREKGVAPFALGNYNDVFYSAERIREVVEERRMPPWHGYANPELGKLKNSKQLSEEEISAITNWVEQGSPQGDPKDAPPPKTWPAAEAWEIGKPDYVYKIKPFTVPKNGVLDYQFFRVPLRFAEDRWFDGVEVKPGNAAVVHHVGLHVVPAGDAEYQGFAGMTALYGLSTELATLINDYVPGDTYNAVKYPAGNAVRIPKNTDLVFEVHYTPNNQSAVVDQSMVAFQWAKEPPREEVRTKVFRKPVGRFRIPPGDPHFRMEDTYYFKNDVYLDAVRPHFHYRGKAFKLEIIERNPNTDEIARRTPVVTVPIYDPDWQRTYELEQPLFLPAGTELLATGLFDNSPFNPRNPNPTKEVLWGQQSEDEMFSTRFKFRLAKDSELNTARGTQP